MKKKAGKMKMPKGYEGSPFDVEKKGVKEGSAADMKSDKMNVSKMRRAQNMSKMKGMGKKGKK